MTELLRSLRSWRRMPDLSSSEIAEVRARAGVSPAGSLSIAMNCPGFPGGWLV
jgi:hypothetical protein